MSAEFYRVRFALGACESWGWFISTEHARLFDRLAVEEVLQVCDLYAVGPDGQTQRPAELEAADVDAAEEEAPHWPTRSQSKRIPWLGRRRRILELLHSTNPLARSLEAQHQELVAPAQPEVGVLRQFFGARRENPQASGQALLAKVGESSRAAQVAPDVIQRALSLLLSELPFPRQLLLAWAAEATAGASLIWQVVAVMEAWVPLTDEQVWSGKLADPEAAPGMSHFSFDFPDVIRHAMEHASALPPLSLECWVWFWIGEVDTEVIAETLSKNGNTSTRGVVQTLVNDALDDFEALRDAPADEAEERERFMGPIAAFDDQLRDTDASTMIRLTYHLATAADRQFMATQLCDGGPGDLAPRVTPYRQAKRILPIWEAGRKGDGPALPPSLKTLMLGFVADPPDAKRRKAREVRQFFDPSGVPLHPDDRGPQRSRTARHGNVSATHPRAVQGLRALLQERHLPRNELALLAREHVQLPRALREHLDRHKAAHMEACAGCRAALEQAQKARTQLLASYLTALGAAPDLAQGWPANEPAPPAFLGASREELLEELRDVLTEARDKAAKRVGADVFARWQSGKIRATEEVIEARSAAASGPVALEAVHPEHSDYVLAVRVEQGDTGPFSDIRCFSHEGSPPHWSFRLTFSSDDEEQALAVLGLSPQHLGALRLLTSDGAQFVSLFDLLLPHRYGSNRDGEDPAFAATLERGGVNGALPGQPTGVAFWVKPGG